MSYLFDTNCLLRLLDKNSPQRPFVLVAFRKLRSNNKKLFCTPQIIAEFWNVCTRPTTARGGFGLTVEKTEKKVKIIRKYFNLVPDNLATFNEWHKLVIDHQAKGLQVHDTKIVASMNVYKIQNLVTFNERDFKRFKSITVINPQNI